jgi:primosomal protein N' (replication factor Y)
MIVQVALPLPINKTFSYRLPDYMIAAVKPLSRVKVPFGTRSLIGFVVAFDETGEGAEGLKAIEELIDPIPLMDRDCYRLCDWASRYYVAPIGLALRYALPPAISIERYCEARAENGSGLPWACSGLKKAYSLLGRKAVYELLSRKTIRLYDLFTDSPVGGDGMEDDRVGFTASLQIGTVRNRLEYYCSRISEELQQERNCLMLLPDRHGAGEFFYRILAKRFPGAVVWYGGQMGTKKRAATYFSARNRRGQIVLGNKSAVFLPLRALGLVIVERPEEDQYRNEDAFKFNAVQLALQRARIEGVPLLLGSISPPVEVMKLVEEGGIELRQGSILPVPVILSAMREKYKRQPTGLQPEILDVIGETLDRNGTVAVHTFKGAYASGLNCSACGQAIVCPRCGSFSVSFRKEENKLVCGTCKNSETYTEVCPSCGSSFIRFFDVGAEYLEISLRESFPEASVVRMAGERDQRPSRPKGSGSSEGRGTIVVGTHVLSKLYGFHADILVLHGWDGFIRSGAGGFRTQEKMFQTFRNLLDALEPQRLLLSSFSGEPLGLSSFLDLPSFYADELNKRKVAEFPPYERFFVVNILKRTEAAGSRVIKNIEELVTSKNLEHRMLGPIEVKGRYAWRIVLKGNEETLSPLLSSLYRLPGVHIEADPLYV